MDKVLIRVKNNKGRILAVRRGVFVDGRLEFNAKLQDDLFRFEVREDDSEM